MNDGFQCYFIYQIYKHQNIGKMNDHHHNVDGYGPINKEKKNSLSF